ncbi:MAG: DNA repair protein [Pseudomonadota bacterium]|nr:DNA repair protein [Pseudomonadota bacterium]
MAKAGKTAEGYSAVYFMEGSQVARQMRLSEFGAFLDGYVGLSDLAETDVRAVLVNLNPDLTVSALVFFRIWFDDEGRADSHWNLPIESLATQGAKGPNMGGGPIRLVCRSQCPDPALADDLWDPDMTPGNNHFQAIKKAVDANALHFKKVEPEEENIPTLTAAESPEASGEQDRARLAQVLREQRLRIKTLQSVHRDSLSDLQREHRLEMQALRGEFTELEQKYERLRLGNEQLKQRLSLRNEQYLQMQEQMQEKMAASEEPSARDEANTNAETVLLREQLERKQRELEMRDDKIVALEQENHELRHQAPADDTLMEQLREQSVFLVAYHAGVGHVTLPYDDIETYFRNPTAYAAERCGLNEPAYKDWLAHYEHPVCRHVAEDGAACSEPLMRVTQPAEFEPGVHDRCEKHRA